MSCQYRTQEGFCGLGYHKARPSTRACEQCMAEGRNTPDHSARALATRASSAVIDEVQAVADGEPPISPEGRAARLAVCAECAHRETSALGDWCGVCGCYLTVRSRFRSRTCPMGKWPG